MATANQDEYLEVDGVPLDTPAWQVTNNYPWLYLPASVRGADVLVADRPGLDPAPVIRDVKRGPLAMEVYGDVDSDGAATADLPTGLRDNVDELLAAIRPPAWTLDGTQTLRHIHPTAAARQAPGRLTVVNFEWVAGNAARLMLDCIIPRGVLRGETVDSSTSGSVSAQTTFTVTHPGNDPQEQSTITLSGTATSVLLENLTWQADGDAYLDVAVDLGNGDVTIDTGQATVTQGGSDVHGNVTAGLHIWRTWLPLAPGDNDIRVTPTGGSVTVTWDHYPTWR